MAAEDREQNLGGQGPGEAFAWEQLERVPKNLGVQATGEARRRRGAAPSLFGAVAWVWPVSPVPRCARP